MGLIDEKQVDKTDWNDHKNAWLQGGDTAPIVYYPLNETTFQVVRKDDNYVAITFLFDSRTKDGGVILTDGREHKVIYKNDVGTSVEVEVGLSPSEYLLGNCTYRDTIGTINLQGWQCLMIYYCWVEFGGTRNCFIHHVII